MTNRRLFPLFTLILGCIGSFWYFIENIDRTFIFGKDGLVPPTEQKHKIQLVLDKPVTTKLVPVTLRLDHVIKCPHWNHDDFAPVDTPTVDVKDDELTARVFSDTISPDHTLIKIFNPKTFYNLCDRLIVQIIARDRNGKFKTHGGDLFRLKIFTAKPYSATSEDKLIDFKNGTYLAYFTVRWSGQVKVQVKLIHPVEILQEMQLNMQGMFGANHTFIGIFSSEASGAEEKRLCRYFPTLTGPICNLSNTLSHGPWFCEKPVNSNLTCDDWKFHQMYTKQSFLNFDAHLSPLSLESLKKSYMVQIKNECAVTVRDQMTYYQSNVNESADLPYCAMRGLPPSVATSGHFFKGRWYPNDCRIHDFSTEDFTSCIAHKRIILLGDSTTRQIFFFFRDSFHNVFEVLPLRDKVSVKQGPITLLNKTLNSSIYFHFHGLPIFGTGLVLRTDFIQYVADTLDSMGSGLDNIVVISLWSHFLAAGKQFYITRWLAIKSAIQKFLDRNPKAKVIIKSANTRNADGSWNIVISSMWNIYQFEGFLRVLFKGEKRIGFVDAFDITRVQPFTDSVHPDNEIVKQIVNRILTYICLQ